MGDSITQFGGSKKGYVTLIDQTLNRRFGAGSFEIINAGISGQKAPDMLARFNHDVIERAPQLVTLNVGVNDVWHDFRNPEWTARVPNGDSGRGVPLPTYLKDVEAMVESAKSHHIQIILVSPTLVYEDLDCAENRRLGEYVRAEKGLAARLHVGFIDLNQTFRDVVAHYQKGAGKRQLLLTVDGVHMNDAGNALMADEILKALGVTAPDDLTPR